MATLASGCIVLWEGGSLWVFDVPAPPPDAPVPRTGTHGHHALQLTYALEGRFGIHLPDGRRFNEPASVVAPDAEHAFTAQGRIALLFVEPESPAGRVVQAHVPPGAGAAALPPMPSSQAGRIAHAMAGKPPDRAALVEIGRELTVEVVRQLEPAAGAAPPPTSPDPPDPRVLRMIAWADEHLLDGDVDLPGAAAAVALSPSRASHLFVEHTGLAFRTWLLWRRAVRAVERYAAGDSLTDAAHAAGFADSAHLSRTFRRLFGLPATVLELR